MNSLSAEQRERFAVISQATFANPFSPERDQLDRQIAQSDLERDALLEVVQQRVQQLLDEVGRDGEPVLGSLRGKDRELVEHALWFDAFHAHRADLDALIDSQLKAGDEPVPVPFADQALQRLHKGGVQPDRALRVLEVFYQLQRAHRFVRGLIGFSPSMVRLRESLWNNVFTRDIRRYDRFLWDRMEDFSTILLGETGTGKGAAAAAIGRSGFIPFDAKKGRFSQSFVSAMSAINLSEYPESLIESELFGHTRGAFTGAVRDHAGAFARTVPHGTLFLDEIGEISLPVQVKLLRVLQERTFSAVGSHDEQRFEGRVVAATHRSLTQLRAQGQFRDDLFYRLCSDIIEVPPLRVRLREQPDELPLLIEHLLSRMLGEGAQSLVEEVHAALTRALGPQYGWPGNVRELEQHVRSALLTGKAHRSGSAPAPDEAPAWALSAAQGQMDAQALVVAYCQHLYTVHGSYADVARISGLDRRTVKKHVVSEPD